MSNTDDTSRSSVVVGVISDLIKKVEDLKQETTDNIASFEKTMMDRQDLFEQKLFDLYVDLRKDIHTSYMKLELDSKQHADVHTAEKLERENDKLIRAQRQFTLNLVLFGIAALIILGVIITILANIWLNSKVSNEVLWKLLIIKV